VLRSVPWQEAWAIEIMYGQMADKKIDANLKHLIDQNLKRVYQDALQEEVPDRFKQLLEQLRQKDAETGGQS
jgi:uncharacterized protein YpiB (UPF0302 family)